jgi:hypothetical protein
LLTSKKSLSEISVSGRRPFAIPRLAPEGVSFSPALGRKVWQMLPSNRRLATIRRYGRCNSGSDLSRAMKTDHDFLLYPLATEGPPNCPACGGPMEIVLHEARENRPDFSRFRCTGCKRSETFVCEE